MFIGTLTVEEHLYFQAKLRMPGGTTEEAVNTRVEELLSDLGLRKCRGTPIGTQLLKGISGGEKKRLAFASEIVNDPSLLFVDEPTSGLDSFMAESVVKTLRAMAGAGKTVVATIHQPSSEVYQMFDKVLFLAEGNVAYFGERRGALPYFAMHGFPCPEYTNPADFFIHTLSVLPNKEEASRRRIARLTKHYAGSEHAHLQKRGASLPRRQGDSFAPIQAAEALREEESALDSKLWEQWRASEASEAAGSLGKMHGQADEGEGEGEAKEGEEGAEAGSGARSGAVVEANRAAAGTPLPEGEEEDSVQPSIGTLSQLSLLTRRAFLSVKRDPTVTNARLAQSLVLSVIAGLIYADTELNQQGIQNLSGAMFFILINQSFSGVFGVLQTFPLELPVFYREHKAGLYRTDTYYLAKTIADLPFQIIFTVIFCSIAYFLVGFSATLSQFLIFTGTIVLCANTAFSLGYLISCATTNVGVALAVGRTWPPHARHVAVPIRTGRLVLTVTRTPPPLLPSTAVVLLPFLLFGGFFVNTDSIPIYFDWIGKLSFFNYGFEILMVNEFEGVENIECNFDGPAATSCATTGEQVLTRFNASPADVEMDVGILFALLVGFRLIAYLALLRQSYRRAGA